MKTSPTFLRSYYVGVNIENILYGMELILYFKTIYILLSNRGALKKSNLFYALFSSMMAFLIIIWIATKAMFGQKMWLLGHNYPGGAAAFWQVNIGVWYMDWATIMIVVLQLMTDTLMIYCCRMIWDSYHVIAIPVVLWVATLILGVLLAWMSSSPGGDYYSGVTSQLSLAYWTIAVFLNLTLTCMICYHVVQHGQKVREYLGYEYASLYFSVFMIVIESVLPYTLSGIVFLVMLGVGSPTSMAFICVYFLMMYISPQMLILRVVSGQAWDNDTFSRPGSTLKFSPDDDTSGSQCVDSDGQSARLQTLPSVYLPNGGGKVIISDV